MLQRSTGGIGQKWAEVLLAVSFCLVMWLGARAQAQGPALTTISDTVYRADGSPAAGTVLISWPSFQTASGDAIAAGNLSITIGPLGAFVAQLAPNVGASPAGTYYTAVLQLDDGTVRTEYWAVPATSPTSIAAILTTPGNGLANLIATQQFVNDAVANRAIDSTVVHLAGSETITGTKQFNVSPQLPSPSGSNDAATKGYVDATVQNVGSGSYVSKAGDTMTGPLNLPGDPTSPSQASDRHYVDESLSAKADLLNGTVPTGELGSGIASSSTCLTGNSTWGACGSGAPAGITYATTAQNWSQTISSALSGGSQSTVTLTPCPVGIDTTSGAGYQVLLSGGGNSEAVSVLATAGACSSGAASGTVTFTPFYSYAAGYTIGSASSGIQETLNAACGVDPTSWKNSQCNVTIPANGPNTSVNTYNVYGTIFLHSNQSVLNGSGTTVNCLGRGACLQVGDLKNSNDFTSNTVSGLSFRAPVNMASNAAFAGVAITQTQRASQLVTITTASPHGFRVGDMVTILFTDAAAYWGDAIVTAVPNSTTFQYTHAGADLGAQSTPGVAALAYVAILDNAMNTHLIDISVDKVGEAGRFNNFFDLWDDENTSIDHFNNQAIPLNANANWTGSFVFSAGNQNSPIAPVITLRDSTITANFSNGVTVYNSNGLYIENTVIQASGPWQVYSSNTTGNYQGAYLKNIYAESGTTLNPLSPARSPFPGLGIGGLIAGFSSGGASFQIAGNGGMQGAFQAGGTGSTPYSYFIVANDTTAGTQTSPMQVLNWLSTGTDSIPVQWPRVANGTDTITYDVLRMATPAGLGAIYPYYGGCPGGSGGTCGYVVKGLSQAAACSGGLVCSYTDSGSGSTSGYTIKLGSYNGTLAFWPGSIVSVNKTIAVNSEEINAVGVGLGGSPLQIADQCVNYGATSPGGYTTCLANTSYASSSVTNQTGTLITDGDLAGGGMTLTKGRLNFSSAPTTTIAAHHIVTLIDSQPGLTQATWGFRPPASANDTWIGTDVTGTAALSAGQLAFGAPVAISNYIGQTGDGVHANWLERLTGSLKEFNVAAKFDQNVSFGGNLVLPQGSGFLPAVGGIGLDTAAGVPVVNIGGTTQQIALTSSNISGQAGTAMALAATPTQCSGAFATGIAANGNANCTTPDVIQLAETAQPLGIPGWGVFWFDSGKHAPYFIDNNGQPAQLGLSNLFNSDPGNDGADTLEERNGNNNENFRVYSTYTNGTAWTRMSLGYDTASGYQVLRSEDANSGNALGLGIYIGSSLKWAFAATGAFKPGSDGLYDIGSDSGQAVRSVFAKTSFNMYSNGRQDFEFANDSVSGTTLNNLAIYNAGASGVQTATTSSTDGVVGIVSSGAGTSNKAVVTWAGIAACNFDAGNPVAGDYVVASTTQAGKCHDTGSATRPSGVQVIGRIEGGSVRVGLGGPSGTSGGAVASVFGRTGTITAASGDYTVAQVTGAAADAAVVHLAGAETITGAKTFASDVTLSGNLNVAGNINQTGTGPTQWSGNEWTATSVSVPSGMSYSLGVGSDNTFHCQLSTALGGGSCLPVGAVASVFGRTGAVTAQAGDYTAAQVTRAVPNTVTINGHALSANVAVSASDLTTGTLPHAQLPALVSGDIPNNGANTSGSAASLSAASALPSGTTATTVSAGDNSTKVATTGYVKSEMYMSWTCPVAGSTAVSQNCNWTLPVGLTITGFDLAANTAPAGCTTYPVMQVWDGTAGAEVGSYSIALSSGTNFYGQVAGSANVAAGHQLRVKVTTAAAGCSTNAAGVVASVTYQMQN